MRCFIVTTYLEGPSRPAADHEVFADSEEQRVRLCEIAKEWGFLPTYNDVPLNQLSHGSILALLRNYCRGQEAQEMGRSLLIGDIYPNKQEEEGLRLLHDIADSPLDGEAEEPGSEYAANWDDVPWLRKTWRNVIERARKATGLSGPGQPVNPLHLRYPKATWIQQVQEGRTDLGYEAWIAFEESLEVILDRAIDAARKPAITSDTRPSRINC